MSGVPKRPTPDVTTPFANDEGGDGGSLRLGLGASEPRTYPVQSGLGMFGVPNPPTPDVGSVSKRGANGHSFHSIMGSLFN